MKRIGDDLVAWLKEHEDAHHEGERCGQETLNALAYLAHRVGIDPKLVGEWGDLFIRRLLDYDAIHAEHDDASDASARLLSEE